MKIDKQIANALWNSYLQLLRSRAEQGPKEVVEAAVALGNILDRTPEVANTILALECRALLAEVRTDWMAVLKFRQAEVNSMLRALAGGGRSGVTREGRMLRSQMVGEIDDTEDVYDPEDIVNEWGSIVWAYCELEQHEHALRTIDEIEAFAALHAVCFDASARRLAVYDDEVG